MASIAPYTTSMRLGQGYNSYAQEICIDGAVEISPQIHNGVAASSITDSPALQSQRALPATPSVVDAALEVSSGSHSSPPAESLGTTTSTQGPVTDLTLKSDWQLEVDKTLPQVKDTGAITMVRDASNVINGTMNMPTASNMPYRILDGIEGSANQIVTYSTRSVQNISDVVDALNISSSLSIKYGSITGNGSAAFVNADKINESDINYIIQVKVTNQSTTHQEQMSFKALDGMADIYLNDPDSGAKRFTQAYGDCFISDFIQGGEFSAIVSIKVSDKEKVKSVALAASASLAIGTTPLLVGGGAKMDDNHAETLANTEISISVNWVGGGEIKKPESQWTLPNLVLVANAFPSMVCHHWTNTSAILTPYTSLRSFQEWQLKNKLDIKPLDYSTCQLYTDDLFSAYLAYKAIWKKINLMLKDAPKYVSRKRQLDAKKAMLSDGTTKLNLPIDRKTSVTTDSDTSQDFHQSGFTKVSSSANRVKGWRVDEYNQNRNPISTDPLELNNARLVCREAMSLIVEEAAALVSEPGRAQATFDEQSGLTSMKIPEYSFPEILDSRLPLPDNSPGGNSSHSEDYTIIPNSISQDRSYKFGPFIGEPPAPGRHHIPFCSLALAPLHTDHISALSIHVHRPSVFYPSAFAKASDGAIGGIGFAFNPSDDTIPAVRGRRQVQADLCSYHVGEVNFEHPPGPEYRELAARVLSGKVTRPEISLAKVIVKYMPNSGVIQGLTFVDADGVTQLAWNQPGGKIDGLKVEELVSPSVDGPWRFAGLAGMFDKTRLGSTVLAKIGVVWQQT